MASLIAQLVKNLHAMQESQVQSLSQEDSLESYILYSVPSSYLTSLYSGIISKIIDLLSQ